MSILDSITSIKCRKGIYTIILTAIILTIFEILFFYKIIAPGVQNEMTININKIAIKIADNVNSKTHELQKQNPLYDYTISQTTSLLLNDTNGAILNTLADREKILTDSLNKYTVYTGIVILCVFVALLVIIYMTILYDSDLNIIDEYGILQDANMFDPTIYSIITVALLICFQILFFFFGKKFKYPGTFGKEELLYDITSSIGDPSNNTLAQKDSILLQESH